MDGKTASSTMQVREDNTAFDSCSARYLGTSRHGIGALYPWSTDSTMTLECSTWYMHENAPEEDLSAGCSPSSM